MALVLAENCSLAREYSGDAIEYTKWLAAHRQQGE